MLRLTCQHSWQSQRQRALPGRCYSRNSQGASCCSWLWSHARWWTPLRTHVIRFDLQQSERRDRRVIISTKHLGYQTVALLFVEKDLRFAWLCTVFTYNHDRTCIDNEHLTDYIVRIDVNDAFQCTLETAPAPSTFNHIYWRIFFFNKENQFGCTVK